MVKCKMYRNPFGNITTILIDNIECSYKSISSLVDVFNPQYIVTKILAVDRTDPFFRSISSEQYYIVFPENDTITSETIVVSKTNDLFSVCNLLLKSSPRCISFYEIESMDNLHIDVLKCSDEHMIKNGYAKYAVSIIVEENMIKILFDKNAYNPSQLFKSIKMAFC